eukprot:TRINITY_DN52021_c0_g1_i1.p1 TRINITY_DN52021_c0_g1~~TRINITY_DN52021_c0_g1_i1.p1  ORF type:complete len:366 (-),score=66.42 TRINITY_DN52021_c0_g1_i1:131-1228(-)
MCIRDRFLTFLWSPLTAVAFVYTLVVSLVGVIALLPLLPLLLLRHLFFPSKSTPSSVPSGCRVVVTGGSSGIGKAIAAEFLRRGSRVTLLARNLARLEAARDELQVLGDVDCVSVDVSQGGSKIREALQKTAGGGVVDLLICSAGVSFPGVFEDTTEQQWEQLMAINVMGCANCVSAVLPGMKQRQRGQILLISSMAGQCGVYGLGAYSASKFALRGMAESLRMECKPFNVSVSLAFPPDTDTPMLAAENEAKPLECKKISEGAGLFSAEEVAVSVVDGMRSGNFFVAQGIDGLMLSHLTAGMVPSPSLLDFSVGVLLGPLFRVIAVCHSVPWDWMVEREHHKKIKTSQNSAKEPLCTEPESVTK